MAPATVERKREAAAAEQRADQKRARPPADVVAAGCTWCGECMPAPWSTGFVSPNMVGVVCGACAAEGGALGFRPAVQFSDGQLWAAFERGPAEDRSARLAAWLAALRPSAVPQHAVSWLTVHSETGGDGRGDVAALMRGWDALPEPKRNGAAALTLAAEAGVTSGKWLFFCHASRMDEAWAAVATAAVAAGFSAKAMPVVGAAGQQYLPLMVYVTRWSDEQQTPGPVGEAMRRALETVFQRGRLMLKPDAFTYLNLNANNPYKIKTSVAKMAWGVPQK